MAALDNLIEDIEMEVKPLSPEVQNMVDWLTLKYEKRLAIYPGILSHPIYQHTAAAKHVRVLGSALEIVRGGRYLPHIKAQLIEDLRTEKNLLFERMGRVTASSEYYQTIIDYLKTLPT